jgi:Domain of unknown function (DUF3387)
MRMIVKRILRAHGFPPDKQKQATLTVFAQAELFMQGLGCIIQAKH